MSKPNEGALEIFMHQLRFRMNVIENTLQTEESGNKTQLQFNKEDGSNSFIANVYSGTYTLTVESSSKEDAQAGECYEADNERLYRVISCFSISVMLLAA